MIITVEGNIGSGKTTLLKQLETSEQHNYIVVFEPVNQWTNTNIIDKHGKHTPTNILDLYYSDNKKYAFLFQMYALQSRCEDLMRKINTHDKNTVFVCERSILTDCEIFAKMLFQNDIMNTWEFHVYYNWFLFLLKVLQPHIIGIIYLQVDPNICVKRIMNRNREGEENISIKYLQTLHENHETWIESIRQKKDIPVMTLQNEFNSIENVNKFINDLIMYN